MPENALRETRRPFEPGDFHGRRYGHRCGAAASWSPATTEILQTEVRGLIPGSKRIVLDLTDLGYMDSSGLGSIIGLYVSVKSAGGRLEVIKLSARVRQLFSITNVLSLFEECGEQNIRIP